MAFKLVAFAALLVVARAGVPLGYTTSLGYGAPVAKLAAPVAHYSAAPAVSYSTVSHGAPAVVAAPSYAYAAAPAVAKIAYAAPTFTKIAAPALHSYAAAPALHSYAAAPALHSYAAAPALHSYAAAPALHSYAAAPALHSYAAAPALHSYAAAPALHTYAAAPVVAKYAAPVLAKTVIAEPSAPANYEFEYSVHDPHTGDAKSQKEVRHGDAVQGSYSLVEADGSKRIVEYTADAHNGFNAIVHREPAAHPVAVKAVAPVATYAAPAYAKYAAAPAIGYAHAPSYLH